MRHIYDDEFSQNQIAETKKSIRGSIFFLLLCVDPKTAQDYPDVDVNKSFVSLLTRIGGLNELLFEPTEVVTVMSLLQAAMDEYQSENFEYTRYRKLILDAGAEVEKIKEV